jgi:3-dehydroquinate dehydratase/shikimate dehydrogenase
VETPLLRMARQKGIPIITGIEMFVQQGARQFEIWTGKPAPESEMLRVVIHALRQQQGAAEPVEVAAPTRLAEPKPEVVEAPAPPPVAVKAVPVKAVPVKAVAAKKVAAPVKKVPVKVAAKKVVKKPAPAKKKAKR